MLVNKGYSTNSSSSHSIIITDKKVDDGHYSMCGEFGWDFFTLATKATKLDYLHAVFVANVTDKIDYKKVEEFWDKQGAALIQEYTLDANVLERVKDGYLDHQSLITLPLSGGKINKTYWFTLNRYILREDIVILGGNDNADEAHPLDNGK